MPNDPPGGRPRPGLEVLVSSTLRRSPLGLRTIHRLIHFSLDRLDVREGHISVTLVSPARIARLHEKLVGAAGPTDIVTLEYARTNGAPLVAEVFIAPRVVVANARLARVTPREELARVVIHGVLHSLGHTHPDGARRTSSSMWKRQESLLRAAQKSVPGLA